MNLEDRLVLAALQGFYSVQLPSNAVGKRLEDFGAGNVRCMRVAVRRVIREQNAAGNETRGQEAPTTK